MVTNSPDVSVPVLKTTFFHLRIYVQFHRLVQSAGDYIPDL